MEKNTIHVTPPLVAGTFRRDSNVTLQEVWSMMSNNVKSIGVYIPMPSTVPRNLCATANYAHGYARSVKLCEKCMLVNAKKLKMRMLARAE